MIRLVDEESLVDALCLFTSFVLNMKHYGYFFQNLLFFNSI